MKSNKRTLFLLILLLLVGAIGYPIIKGNIGSNVLETNNSEPIISEQVNQMLSGVMNAKLDPGVLNSSKLLYLHDFTVPLLGFPIGRANPFAPIK